MDRVQIPEERIKKVVAETISNLSNRVKQQNAGSFANRYEMLGRITEGYRGAADAIHIRHSAKIRERLLDLAVESIYAVACMDEMSLE